MNKRFHLIVILALALLVLACGSGSGAARPTSVPPPTELPAATQAPSPTSVPAPTALPAPTESADAHYLQIAQTGALPVVRASSPKGAWVAHAQSLGQGPEVRIEFPMTIGLSNEQTVRQAKLQGAGIVKRLFDGDPALTKVNVIGTLPDGPNNAELAAVSLVLERAAFAQWDGTADSLPWQVSPRLN